MGGMLGDIGATVPVTKAAAPKKIAVSAGIMAGNILVKTRPEYPAEALAARIQGTVVLQATISMEGAVKDLKVISGPVALYQAALDAVKNWRYKPFLLNGEPVEVGTQINVVFALGG